MADKDNEFILNFIDNYERYSLNEKDEEDKELLKIKDLNRDLKPSDIVLYKIEKVTYEEEAPQKEALENVLSAVRIPGVNFVYLICGDKNGISFYYGISRDLVQETEIYDSIQNVGGSVLKTSMDGNFRGSRLHQMNENETVEIIKRLSEMKCFGNIDGVPGISENSKNFHGVDRLIDVMLGDDFAMLVTAKHMPVSPIRNFESNIYKFYDMLLPFSKRNIQTGENSGNTVVKSKTVGTSASDTQGTQQSKTENHGKSHQETRSSAKANNSDTRTDSTGTTDNEGTYSENSGSSNSHSESTSESQASGTNYTEGTSESTTCEHSNKNALEWLKYIDEVILKRLDYGKGKGIYIADISLFTATKSSMVKLENTVTSLFSGDSGNKIPLKVSKVVSGGKKESALKNFQIPIAEFTNPITKKEVAVRTALSQYVTESKCYLGNWFSVGELSVIAGLPQKEVVGLSLREEVEFGLNYKNEIEEGDRIELGNIVQSGSVLKMPVFLDKKELSKHIFVTGVTGSGKTTTCQKLLIQSNLPFLVIEPAKTEYRILSKKYDDILIFTLGKDKVAPFRLNPFEFYPHESITSHVDMIKASIEAAFDMEAAIPQIIEKSIYACYEDCGWNIADDTNKYYENPFADGVFAFPTLSDLIEKTEKVVNEQGFDARLKNDYIGSVKARLQGLIVGSKGLMLNTRRSVNFRDLVHRRVILELEEIRSGNEKALIMGFVLSNLTEAIKAEYYDSLKSGKHFEHITLVEEAHRLLSRYESGDSLSKKQGVEMFTDMLAEVRKYGESLIVVDQIPGKLAPEVLKNTNTKIVHKIFALDDKDAIGNTMALSNEQKEFLSFLDKGRAVVISQGWESSIQVQITPETDTGSREIVGEDKIRALVVDYYCSNYQRGIIKGFECLTQKPGSSDFERFVRNDAALGTLVKTYNEIFSKYKVPGEFIEILKVLEEFMSLEMIARYLRNACYFKDESDLKLNEIISMLKDIKAGEFDSAKYDEKLSYGRRTKSCLD